MSNHPNDCFSVIHPDPISSLSCSSLHFTYSLQAWLIFLCFIFTSFYHVFFPQICMSYNTVHWWKRTEKHVTKFTSSPPHPPPLMSSPVLLILLTTPPFTSSIFHFIFADSSPPSKHTHVPEYKHSQKLKAEQSSFEGVKPLVDVHPPLGTWDESAAES